MGEQSESGAGSGHTGEQAPTLGAEPAGSIPEIGYRVDDGVARITINAADTGNSLTGPMRDRLAELLDWAGADLAVRVVVLTGAGDRHFCTGANLRGPQSAGPVRPEGAPERAVGDAARLIRRGWQRLVAAMLDCEKPIIAAVNGTAAGGGAQLVLAADLVVFAEHAELCEVFVRRGILPDAGGAYLLPRLVGPQRAKELMFLGDKVPAAEAVAIGIGNRVVPGEALTATVDELAARLASGPTKAIALTKWLLNRSFESSRQTAFDEEAYSQDLLTASADFSEGIAAFMQRRDPNFSGW